MADKKWALTTGSAPGGYESTTYTDIQTWSVAEAYDLTTAGDSVYLECFDDWATGLEQGGSQIRDTHGWVTDTTNYITVKPADGEGHGGLVGGGFFLTTVSVDGAIIPYGIDYVFEGLEIVASSSFCVNASLANDSTVNVIDKCILSGSTSRPINQNTGYTLLTNSLIIDGSDRGIDNVLTINCTIDNFPNDYAALARNLAWRNVVVTNSYGANDPWYQDGSVDYCATDYSGGVSGSNSVTLTADPYNDRASNDYSISNTSELYDAGVDLTSTYPQLAYDIAGNPRSSTYSIGAYEYVSGAAGVTVTVPQANLSLSTFAPDVSVPVTAIEIDVGQANLTLSTTAPTVERTANRDITVAQANLALSTAAPDVETTDNVAIDGVAGNLTLSTTAPTVERTDNRDITVAQANISLSTAAPSVLVTEAGAIVVDAANLTISAEAPTVEQTANRSITVGAANLTLSTTAPTASRNIGISPAAGSLLLSTLAPELTVAANQAITVDAAALALSTAAPTVEQTTNSVSLPGAASLSLSGFAPTIEQTGRDIWTDVSAASTSWTEITGASTTWTEI